MSWQRRSIILSGVIGFALMISSEVPLKAADAGMVNKPDSTETAAKDVTQGALRIVDEDGSVVECPLKHTDVKAEIAGFVARVHVTQTFHNPTDETIEAVYVFPLPHQAAVDDMTMILGDRKIVGLIKRRDEARRIYQQALTQGQTAALLEQERPNIFTQSVGNIRPGQEVEIRISYVDVLKYDMGEYEFHFPMVVGPRFIPGSPISTPETTDNSLQGKVSPPVPNTDRVPDAERISPPVLKPGMRNGHDITLTISLNAGVPIQNLAIANHKAKVDQHGDREASVTLSEADAIPNKDFVARYDVVGDKPEMAVLAHTGSHSRDADKLGNGYFMLMVQPKEDDRLMKSPPREIVFLVDVSGSMRGAKTAKVRETMQNMLGVCRDIDTVQVITFASQATKLFEQSVPVNEASITRALQFTQGIRGSGGTHMLKGVKLAIDAPLDSERVRIIVMLTDGFIGNEAEIIAHVGKQCGDHVRFWAVGIGQSPNMFLVDGVAKQGGGMGKRLGLNDEAEPLAQEVITRIQRAQLANITIDWGELTVAATYPTRLPELWAGRPLIVYGRYDGGGPCEIRVSGTVEGESISWPLSVQFPKDEPEHDVLAKVWARQRIEDLMQQSYYFGSPAIEEEVTAIALDYRLMSQYTSFVAVDEKQADTLPAAQPPRRMLVPVPLPEGAQWEGFFGAPHLDDLSESAGFTLSTAPARPSVSRLLFSREAESLRAGAPAAPAMAGRGYAGPGGFGGANAAGQWAYKGIASPQPAARGAFRRGMRLAQNLAEARFKGKGRLLSAQSAFGTMPAGGIQRLQRSRAQGIALGEADHAAVDLGWSKAALHLPNSLFTAWRSQAGPLSEVAEQAKQTADKAQQAGDHKAARVALVQALFLDQAAVNFQNSPGQLAAQAYDDLEELDRVRVKAWTKLLPALDDRLNLVIRDRSVAEALQLVASATSVPIQFLPGSAKDAMDLNQHTARVSYLDLRGATMAQALDWILKPVRLNWRLEHGSVVAGSDRRMPGESCWVYDLSLIAIPAEDELGDSKDVSKLTTKLTNESKDFLKVIRQHLKIDNQNSVCWFAPGQLLVFGKPDRHAQIDDLLAALTDAERKTQLQGDAGKLQSVTARRARENQEHVSKRAAARQRARVAQAHATFGWQLLAAAAAGQLDDEAFTELQIAWEDPITSELLAGKGSALVWRSLWMVAEASKAMPDCGELNQLAGTAEQIAEPLVPKIVDKARKSTEDHDNYMALVYLSLALRNDAQLLDKTREVLLSPGKDKPPFESARLITESLLADREQIDVESLTKLAAQGIRGEDLVTLAALACHRAGDEAWRTYRAEARDLLGGQPLPGHVVLLVHRLPENRLVLARN